jgi:twitching motility protein PilT
MFSKDEEQQVRERLEGSLRYIVGQRLVPKKSGGRLLVTELMGSSLRTREVIQLGENDNRRLHDIIEAGSSSGWHSFEQSLLKAYEEDLITEETALLYCVNKPTMRQRLDISNSRSRRTAKPVEAVSMMVVPPADSSTAPATAASTAAPAVKPKTASAR